ncbi:MAG TPA: 6-carboxytetrahydropterin synthase QueD [bacterium]|jgi:6-pyruvoyltetrahydropterin/6-carboxytetrahydropterin synthase
MEVFKTFIFDAAHMLPEVPPEHKCRRLHGHTYRVLIYLAGGVDEKMGWVEDFADLKAAFKPLYQQLDHNYLNEVDGLENPTCENIARWIWERVKPSLPALSRIVIHEGESNGVVYLGD